MYISLHPVLHHYQLMPVHTFIIWSIHQEPCAEQWNPHNNVHLCQMVLQGTNAAFTLHLLTKAVMMEEITSESVVIPDLLVFTTALMSGVKPNSSVTLGSAPASRSFFTRLMSPLSQAACKIVPPLPVLTRQRCNTNALICYIH